MKSSIIFTFLLPFFAFVECVKVSLYYEALCPDSTSFIARQLFPNYAKLKNYMQLELIPYGKATHNYINKKWYFQCQHGRAECEGNKYQSCALAQNNGEENDISFVYCVMRERNPSDLRKMEICARRIGIDWAKISACAQTALGDDLLAQNGNKTYTLDPNISFVPTIVYDDIYDDYLQELSLTHFAAVVCSKIQGQKPRTCDNEKLPKRNNFWDYFS